MLGGRIVNDLPDNPYAACSQYIVSCGYEQQGRRGGGARLFTTSNLVVPRSAFLRLGGFDTAFPGPAGEDYDFCQRWHDAGLPAAYVRRVLHAHEMGFGGFCRQHYGYGEGLYQWRRALAKRTGRIITTSAAAFYLELLRYPLRNEPILRGILTAALVGVGQLCTACRLSQSVRGIWPQFTNNLSNVVRGRRTMVRPLDAPRLSRRCRPPKARPAAL